MTMKVPNIPAEYIVPLNMNGLRGRLLRMPAPKGKNREILLVYGHHASLERYYGFAEVANEFGAVTMPDLPGFGGMDAFYKIGEKPDLDTMADYLASIIKLRFKNRRFTIIGISYGFIVLNRMLQKYPELVKRIDLVISIAGFSHYEDFVFTKRQMRLYRFGTRVFKGRLTSAFFRNVCLHPAVIRSVYSRTSNAKHKFKDLTPDEGKLLTEFEVHLWRCNDARTHMETTLSMLTVDNCRKQVDTTVHHIGVEVDNYFDKDLVEQHMRVAFKDFAGYTAPLKAHMPNHLAGKAEIKRVFPRKVLKLLQ